MASWQISLPPTGSSDAALLQSRALAEPAHAGCVLAHSVPRPCSQTWHPTPSHTLILTADPLSAGHPLSPWKGRDPNSHVTGNDRHLQNENKSNSPSKMRRRHNVSGTSLSPSQTIQSLLNELSYFSCQTEGFIWDHGRPQTEIGPMY